MKSQSVLFCTIAIYYSVKNIVNYSKGEELYPWSQVFSTRGAIWSLSY